MGADIDTARPGRRRAPQHFAPGFGCRTRHGTCVGTGRGPAVRGTPRAGARGRKRGGGAAAKRAAHLLVQFVQSGGYRSRPRTASRREPAKRKYLGIGGGGGVVRDDFKAEERRGVERRRDVPTRQVSTAPAGEGMRWLIVWRPRAVVSPPRCPPRRTQEAPRG